ncbi:MAG: amino acid adenylation domain-containing protein, partial [Acidobacteria bacterium]|nr:amino acid adenylation domain-containing protein [Acidobacteriota bacterium]
MAKAYPDKVAVKVGAANISYDSLNRFANRIAWLIKNYQCPHAALLFDRSIEMAAGIIAVLKAGKTYVPLDPSYPEERWEYMLNDSQAELILTNLPGHLKNTGTTNIPIIDIDSIKGDKRGAGESESENPGIEVLPSHLAYILYTSGSTGKPKGVMQNHGNVLHFARVYANALHIHPDDRLTLFSSYCFDAAKMDIFGALLNGATLYPFDIKKGGNLSLLPFWLQKERITIFHAIPTVYRYFTGQLSAAPGAAPEKDRFPQLRLIVLGGEAVYKKDVDNYQQYFPDHCLFINGLGPTESTVTLQYFIDKKTTITKRTVPVGFPVAETQVLIINDKGAEAQVFEVGEIVYKSDYLAVGYWRDAEKTAAAFTTDPLTGTGRVYHSGDLGRRLPDGSIEFMGRKDFRVKIRGFRIETGEIETTLLQMPGIKETAVVAKETEN